MHTFVIEKSSNKDTVVSQLGQLRNAIFAELEHGNVCVKINEEARTSQQNRKLWAMCSDFRPIVFNGKKWDSESWKNFLMSAFNNEVPTVGLNGEPVSMSLSTSKLSKKKFSELVEFIYAQGTALGVRWSEPALKAYEEYRQY